MTANTLRIALLADIPAIEALIARSIRTLGAKDYTSPQIEMALRSAFGVDTQLIRDGTYFVVARGDEIIGCGGWSKRRTLFGSDARNERDATELQPPKDAAKIRAFFVDPAHARQGIGRMLLDKCESLAQQHGFQTLELMATLPGMRLYGACGYIAGAVIHHALTPNLTIDFVPMTKTLPRE